MPNNMGGNSFYNDFTNPADSPAARTPCGRETEGDSKSLFRKRLREKVQFIIKSSGSTHANRAILFMTSCVPMERI